MHDVIPPQQETSSLSLRERQKWVAQSSIEETALRLFLQQGYEHTSIQDIADAVKMKQNGKPAKLPAGSTVKDRQIGGIIGPY